MKIQPLFNGEYYTEGPAMDPAGNIYFTTLSGGEIIKIDRHGVASAWAESLCPNGQRILSSGDHLVCDSGLGKVIRFDASGKKIEDAAFGPCEDLTVRTPNDLAVDEDAGFYFTDSVRNTGAVYFFGKDGSRRVIARDLDYPNGICLSKNRRRLFVAESYKNQILFIDLKEPGVSQGAPEIFCQLPFNVENPDNGNLPDGILLDTHDRLWVAHYGMGAVQVVSGEGRLIANYKTGIPLTSNLFFIEESRELLVTGGSAEPGPGNVHLLVFPQL